MLWLALKSVFGLGVLSIASFGFGAWIAILLPSTFTRFERVTLAFLGGLGLLSSTLFLVGQVRFTRVSISVVLAGGILIATALFRRVFPGSIHVSALKSVPKLPGLIIAFILLLTAISGLAEVTGDWGNDAVAYHLLGPKVWLRNGIIRPVPDNCHTAFPQIPETLFATLWSIGGSRAPDYSSFLTFGLLLAIAGSLAIRCGTNHTGAWWVAALVATMPAVDAGGHRCLVDAIFAAFVIAAIRIGLDAQKSPEWALVGMLSGFAIGTKYTALLVVPVLIGCIVLLNLDRNGNLHGLGAKVVLALVIAFLIGSPYYIRNWTLLGCPIYPPPPGYKLPGANLFCSPRYLSADAISEFHAYIRKRGAGLGRGFFAFLVLPFNLTYHTSNFHGAGGIGLCPIALGPIGICSFRNNATVKLLVVLTFLLTFAWFETQQESRFLIDVYVLVAVFAGLGWQAVLTWGRNFSRRLASLVVLISLSYGLFMILRANMDEVKSVFSPHYAALRRQATIPYLASFEFINRDNAVRRVLILDRSVPPYYSDKDYVKPIGQWGERTLPGAPDSSQALAEVLAHQLDVSHVLDVNSEVSSFQIKPGTPGLVLVFEADSQRVYLLKPINKN